MSCLYNYYKKDDTYYPHLYCKLSNEICLYSKKCEKEKKYIPLETQNGCYMAKEVERDIPKNSYYIKSYRKDKLGNIVLYVEVDDRIKEIFTKFTEINQKYIYLKETKQGYNCSLKPFRKSTKKEQINE